MAFSLSLLVIAVAVLSVSAQDVTQHKLIGQWTFEKGEEFKDLTGNFGHIKLKGAVIKDGQLDLGVNKWAVTGEYRGPTIEEKTLVSWVSIDNLNVQRGSVLTLDKISKDQFDAIVLGERQRNRWMSGSSYFRRTEDFSPGFAESKTNEMIQLAITYSNVNSKASIKFYRNGQHYGSYTKGPFVTWPSGDAEVFWGIRHGTANGGGPDHMDAHIEESRIYAGVLTSEELMNLSVKKFVTMGCSQVNTAAEVYETETYTEPINDEYYTK